MASGNYEFQSDFARKYLTKGQEKGREEGLTMALLTVLQSRGVRVSKKARARILSCVDIKQLNAWIGKATSVASVDELF